MAVSDIYLARQPIYDRRLNVHAYELLYRNGEENSARIFDGDAATAQVLVNALIEIGLPDIIGASHAFINLTRYHILEGLPAQLAQDRVVLEVLEDILPSAELIQALQALRAAGFRIALDDFVYSADKQQLMEVADIVKLDLPALPGGALTEQVKALRAFPVELLAEKVETPEEYEYCKALGFDYFQGYFFCRPHIITGRASPSNRMAILQLLATLQDPQLDFGELQTLIARDVSLSYRILRYINSAHFNIGRKIESIQQAVTLLGLKTIRTWVAILAMTSVDDKPYELILTALIRAHMCESLAAVAQESTEHAFTVGLFSVLDAFLDKTLDDVLHSLPLSDDLNDALLQHRGCLGELLRLVLDYERGHWDAVTDSPLDATTLRDTYLQSIQWANEISQGLIGQD
jgi:EAL and modified HD-GYP domain-containing signal transduction protein